MIRLFRYCPLIIFGLVAISSGAAEKAEPPRLAIDVNLYPYLDRVGDDTDLTVTINAPLPGRFSYFSYLNFSGVIDKRAAEFDRSEQNLRWSLSDNLPIDLNLQAILVGGDGNDLLQLGVGWRVNRPAHPPVPVVHFRVDSYLLPERGGDERQQRGASN